MYELVKHTAEKSTVLFTSPCETIARARFYKSAALLKINETLELRHDGQVVYSIKACGYSVGSKADEDGVVIFPEAPSTWGKVEAVLIVFPEPVEIKTGEQS